MRFPTFFLSVFLWCTVSGQIPHFPNVPYGTDPQQIFDFYFPIGPGENDTKIIILIHGGAWGAGQKSDMDGFIPFLQQDLPGHFIANMEYRLGTQASPGFPKQLEDIALAIQYIKSSFTQEVTFALMGSSAGAHLSMLYEYAYDQLLGNNVKAVVSMVGPTDITDPNYIENPDYDQLFFDLVGACFYLQCPALYNQVSPVAYVSEYVAPTIGFYGSHDPLVPSSQMPILKERLEYLGVASQFTVYQGGHGDWAWEDIVDMMTQIANFLQMHW